MELTGVQEGRVMKMTQDSSVSDWLRLDCCKCAFKKHFLIRSERFVFEDGLMCHKAIVDRRFLLNMYET